MYRLAAFFGLAGLAAATGLVIWSGWAQVLQALSDAGWGIVLVALFHLIPLAVSSTGWRALLLKESRPSWLMFVYFMWIRAAVNNLMPVARIGGEIAAIRLMTGHGMRRDVAIASTVVELTLSISAIFLFIIIGVILFALHVADKNTVAQLIWGIVFSLPLLVALITIQKFGFFTLLSRLFRLVFRDKWTEITGSAEELDKAVYIIYSRKKEAALCAILQLLAWSTGAVEIWLSLLFLGHPLPLLESFMLEALIQGTASVAFAIPGALGVQEAGFLLFGSMLGLSSETAAALAVMRRCRDLICYVPGLFVWQIHEGKKLLRS